MSQPICTAMLAILLLAGVSHAEIQLIGIGALPGTTADLSGLKGKQKDGTPHNRLGGHGSAIAYTGQGNLYVLASDRGPVDGAADFACRVHWMEIAVEPGQSDAVRFKLVRTTLLANEAGRSFVGLSSAFDKNAPSKSMRLDPEGIRVGKGGTLFISDEYGPFLGEYNSKGKRLRSITVSERFHPNNLGAKIEEELPPKNTRGRQPNRGMEGLAISADGSKLYGLMQGPVIQDAALDKDLKRVGHNCRLIEFELASGKTREFAYHLEHAGNGLNEILAIGGSEFLVIERDGLAGKDAQFKKIVHIDISKATDVSAIPSLPPKKLPDGIRPVTKKSFIDMLDKRWGLVGEQCPEKFEGLAFGPDLPDGRRLLLVTVDNDFVAEVPFRVLAFAIDPSDLPAFERQRFGK